MTNLLNPYRFAVAGNQLPAGAIAHADFLTSYFYAGGAETTAAGMFDLYKPARHTAQGYLVDWNIDYDGLNAKAALLADVDAALDDGATFYMEMEGPYKPTIEWIGFGDNTDLDDASYYLMMGGTTSPSDRRGVIWDISTISESGPGGEILGSAGGPPSDPLVINKGAFCIFRDEGGGNFGVAASINGNTAWGNANVGIDGSTVAVDHCRWGGFPEWFIALGPDDYIRKITIYPAQSDAQLEALTAP